MRLQPKNVLLAFLAVLFAPFVWVLIFTGSDVSESVLLEKRLAEMRDRLHQAESLGLEKEHDMNTLRSQMHLLVNTHSHQSNVTSEPLLDNTSQTQRNTSEAIMPGLAQRLFANMSLGSSDIYPPGMYHFLPHLVGKPQALRPAVKVSKGRDSVSIVVGVPTIKRDVAGYLMQTLQSLVDNLEEPEKKDCLIIVFVAEPWDQEYSRSVIKEIEEKMPNQVASGLIEVIAPPAEFYPDMDKLKLTLGDTADRVKWRTKQNLDFSYLMLYARSRGTYYVQLEDDVVTKPRYFSIMKNFALNQKTNDWILLEFSYLGFIGKMFKSRDLPLVAEFFIMFHNDKPIDWLLDHLLNVKVCSPEKDAKHCQRMVSELRRRFKPSLFQHIGTHSSLKGKLQKLKDKDFGKGQVHRPHLNPNAEVSTTLKAYQKYTLSRAYLGETFFWGLLPQPQDMVLFKFLPPIHISKYTLRSGNPDHPGDRFFNTTVEVKTTQAVSDPGLLNKFPSGGEGFMIIGQFIQETGLAEGELPLELGQVESLRLRVHEESQSWVILSEIFFQEAVKH